MKRALGMLAAVLLVACGTDEPKLTSGTVVEKHYDDDDGYFQPLTCSGGKVNVCTGGFWVDEPERWVLTVEGEHEGETITEEVSVTEAEYQRQGVGEPWQAEVAS